MKTNKEKAQSTQSTPPIDPTTQPLTTPALTLAEYLLHSIDWSVHVQWRGAVIDRSIYADVLARYLVNPYPMDVLLRDINKAILNHVRRCYRLPSDENEQH